ncbi:MAG TPA: diguanylate cyclase [Rhodocyclaceae bacterium]|nr:diguanylate cyclase [Rhodocyclaceae bacterium]
MSNKAATAREKIARLRASFIEQLPGRLAQAQAQYGQLVANPTAREVAVELHRFLHSIKGTGRSFGFSDLAQTAAHGEEIAGQFLGSEAPPSDWKEALEVCLDSLARNVAALRADTGMSGNADSAIPAFDLRSQAGSGELPRKGGRLIYLCDDEPVLVGQLAAQIACFGYEPVVFYDPATLQEAVRARRPDAIVMDINFPGGDRVGTDALLAINRESEQPVPSVFLSARDDFAARLSAVQCGSVAYFHKPARALDLVAALDDATQQQTPEPYRILIVDDEPEIAGYHAVILQEAGMVTRYVGNPADVLGVLAEFRPDMVLMDMYMPVCSGRDLARLIRQLPEYVGLPIVFLSSETDRSKQFSAMRVGAEGFLTKPVVPEDLVAAVGIRAERMRTLRSLMAKDSLTGLFNHTTTTQLLENAIATASRTGAALSFAMIDIDHFKSVNDTYGHPIGDQVILALARVLQQRLRNSDIVGRYGGEEFAVILPDVDASQASKLIDTLREDFGRVLFQAGGIEFSCTFSAGVACHGPRKGLESLREAADKALYAAKHGGRNRVVVGRKEV